MRFDWISGCRLILTDMRSKMTEEIVRPLVEWYRRGHRKLPWREQKNPYYIWVSEIMLQQTRVEAVRPYFERFTGALPQVEDLADCPEEKLLKLWEGLGYYNRVRNMPVSYTHLDVYKRHVQRSAKIFGFLWATI